MSWYVSSCARRHGWRCLRSERFGRRRLKRALRSAPVFFSEEFKGTSLDSDKWDATVGGSGAITVGGGVAAFVTGAADTAYMGSRGSLDFSSSPDNWGAEIKFQVNGVYRFLGVSQLRLAGWTNHRNDEWLDKTRGST